MRRGKESAERIKKRASCSTPDTIDTHWAVVVTTSKGDGANADRFQLRPGPARPLAPSLYLQFPLWSITLSASDMHIQQLIKAVKADRYDQIFGQCHVVPTYMPASNLLYASAITVSFMQIYTRLPVKVKVFTVPVKGCIPLPKR